MNSSFVDAARAWAPSSDEDIEDLDEDYRASYVISYSVETIRNQKGHWKVSKLFGSVITNLG